MMPILRSPCVTHRVLAPVARKLASMGACAIVLLGTACATGREVLHLDVSPDLTWEEIRGGRVAVVGLLPEPLAGPGDPAEEETLLGRTLRRERPDLEILDEFVLDRALPAGLRTSILEGYLHDEVVPPDAGMLSASLPEVRYLLLARVEHEDLDRAELEETYEEARTDGRQCAVDQVTRKALREMVVRLELVELATGRPVLLSRISQASEKESHEQTWDSCESLGSNLFGGLIRSLFGIGDPPDVPRRAEVLEKLYEGFAEQLPRR